MRTRLLACVSLVLLCGCENVQGQAYEGYTLFNPNNARTTYLIDMDNQVYHTWQNDRRGGYSVYFLENGNLLRPCEASNAELQGAASAGMVQEIDWDGNVVWEFEYSSSTYITHHDIEPMPNGNVLLIAWEVKSAEEAVEAGRWSKREIWPDHIIEVQPQGTNQGTIVWEWHAWDHLVQDYDAEKDNYGVIADHPELIDVNLGSSMGPGEADWLHINGISYNPELDQIVISSHYMDEFYVIDHSTTTAEAAGHTGGNSGKGGDILYRWGKPANYDAPGDQYFDVVHCSWWIPEGLPGEGNILIFNNNTSGRASMVVEITPPYESNGTYSFTPGSAYGPSEPTWIYSAGSSFYSNHLGGCQRLPNGNTLICEATSGYLFEVTESGGKVWDYDYGSEIARALRYGTDYPGFDPDTSGISESAAGSNRPVIEISRNPFTAHSAISYELPTSCQVNLTVYDASGTKVKILVNQYQSAGNYCLSWDGTDERGKDMGSGVFFFKLFANQQAETQKVVFVD